MRTISTLTGPLALEKQDADRLGRLDTSKLTKEVITAYLRPYGDYPSEIIYYALRIARFLGTSTHYLEHKYERRIEIEKHEEKRKFMKLALCALCASALIVGVSVVLVPLVSLHAELYA